MKNSVNLLQHAHNPVDWYPWAKTPSPKRGMRTNRYFSVGYSTCHWCHVMAHESFESEEIAAIMNREFVNIKVDREERPDVDRVYMTFVQATTGGGGWPMSVWLTPDLKPFVGGNLFSAGRPIRASQRSKGCWSGSLQLGSKITTNLWSRGARLLRRCASLNQPQQAKANSTAQFWMPPTGSSIAASIQKKAVFQCAEVPAAGYIQFPHAIIRARSQDRRQQTVR